VGSLPGIIISGGTNRNRLKEEAAMKIGDVSRPRRLTQALYSLAS
jgi:hypothetical protein